MNRLRELQTSEAISHVPPTQTAQKLPEDPQDRTAGTSSVAKEQQNKTEPDVGEEDERKENYDESSSSASEDDLNPPLVSVQANYGCSCCHTHLLQDSPRQGRPESASKKMKVTQGEGGGKAKKQAVKENGRKAKQKLNFTVSSRSEEGQDKEAGSAETSEPPPSCSSWSEMSSMLIGSDYCLSPLSPAMEQRLILQYLTPLGEYQEVRVLTSDFGNSSRIDFSFRTQLRCKYAANVQYL